MTREIKNPGRGYSGREKTPLYVYNEKGEFIRKYESNNDCSRDLFKNVAYPLFEKGRRWETNDKRLVYNYVKVKSYFICKSRLGREFLMKKEKLIKSELLQHRFSKKEPVIMYNLLHQPIAEFQNLNIAKKLLNLKNIRLVGKGRPKNDFYFKKK